MVTCDLDRGVEKRAPHLAAPRRGRDERPDDGSVAIELDAAEPDDAAVLLDHPQRLGRAPAPGVEVVVELGARPPEGLSDLLLDPGEGVAREPEDGLPVGVDEATQAAGHGEHSVRAPRTRAPTRP